MTIFWISLLVIVLAFQFVVLFLGPPYLPTLHKQRQTALDILNLKAGQKLVDLGCGDGAVLKAAAKRGIYAVGYEINPLLVIIARFRTWRYRKNVKVVWGNFWNQELKNTDAIFVFLRDSYMKKLDNFMKSDNVDKPVKLVSFAFKIPDKKPAKIYGAIFLYEYR